MRAGWAHVVRTLKPDLARLRKVRQDAAIAPLLDELGSLHTIELEAPYHRPDQVNELRGLRGALPEPRPSQPPPPDAPPRGSRLRLVPHLDEGEAASNFAAAGIEMKRRWLVDRGQVSPALADARMACFMSSVAADSRSLDGDPRRRAVCDDKPAAIQIGFTARHTRVLHVIAYDRAFEKMAAGVLHLEEAIRQGFEEGLCRIDLLAPKAEYKLDWADGTVAGHRPRHRAIDPRPALCPRLSGTGPASA